MPPFLQSAGLIFLGLLPSLIWLAFYYREDCHPEPKQLLARTFLMGIIVAPLAIVLQLGFLKMSVPIHDLTESVLSKTPMFFLWAALVEELIKFFAVYILIMRRPEFDEPLDGMVYMITAALGFAAIENVLILFQILPDGAFMTLSTLILRFIGATLLHALASGIAGYFLGMAWIIKHHSKKILTVGLLIATFFHFGFNMIISTLDSPASALFYTTILLLFMALLISVLFDRLKYHYAQYTC